MFSGLGGIPLTISWTTFLIICPLIFLGGFIDSIAGGGGLITLPAYYLAGLPPALANGTNKLSALAGTSVAAGKYIASGHVSWRCGVASLVGSVPGASFGSFLLTRLPADYVKAGVILALPLVAFFVIKSRDLLPRKALIPASFTLPASFMIGLLIGLYDGLVGPGTGTFLMLAYVSLMGMDALPASGTARLVNLGSNFASAVTMMASGHVLYLLALPAAVFGILGNYLGASLAIARGAPYIRKLLLIVLALLLTKLIADVIF